MTTHCRTNGTALEQPSRLTDADIESCRDNASLVPTVSLKLRRDGSSNDERYWGRPRTFHYHNALPMIITCPLAAMRTTTAVEDYMRKCGHAMACFTPYYPPSPYMVRHGVRCLCNTTTYSEVPKQVQGANTIAQAAAMHVPIHLLSCFLLQHCTELTISSPHRFCKGCAQDRQQQRKYQD